MRDLLRCECDQVAHYDGPCLCWSDSSSVNEAKSVVMDHRPDIPVRAGPASFASLQTHSEQEHKFYKVGRDITSLNTYKEYRNESDCVLLLCLDININWLLLQHIECAYTNLRRGERRSYCGAIPCTTAQMCRVAYISQSVSPCAPCFVNISKTSSVDATWSGVFPSLSLTPALAP